MGWTAEPPAARGQTRDRWESWQALMDQAAEFARPTARDLDAFVDDLDRRAAEQHAPVADGVTLATFHAAKGLEWDSVFLCGLQDGTLPITYAETPGRGRGGAPAALRRHDPRPASTSRCRGRWPASPAASGSRKPSRFLDAAAARDALPAAAGRSQAKRRPDVPRVRQAARRPPPRRTAAAAPTARRPTTRRSSSGCASGARSAPATEEVPAFVVFSNATLELIAELDARSLGKALLADQRHRPARSSQKYGEDLLELVG